MPVGEHEPVAVGPAGVGRVVLHHSAVEHVRQWRQRHRRALVAAVRLERGVHREATHDVDGLAVLFCGE